MRRVFVYLDNSNIFISAQHLAEAREGDGAGYRVRMQFSHLVRLAHADRPVERAIAVGSIPPELERVWKRLKEEGVAVELLERGQQTSSEQGVDQVLQTKMLRDGFDFNGTPGIVVLLTGDGRGFYDGVGFHADIERLHRRGWGIEVLAWRHSCNQRMREWGEKHGLFVALDDFYESITFLEPALSDDSPLSPDSASADARVDPPRIAVELDLKRRPTLK